MSHSVQNDSEVMLVTKIEARPIYWVSLERLKCQNQIYTTFAVPGS